MTKLIGKTIKHVFVSLKNQDYLKFVTDSGDIVYRAYGDCCSESYFSDVNRTTNLFGKKIIDVKEVELMEEEYLPMESRQEEDKIYGYKIITESGECLIIMRNSSNGYYGGWCGVVDGIPQEEELYEITRDFNSNDIK
jgi:hypothetical protein